MNKYAEDKERMDEITEKIANREPVKVWAATYWMAVAIVHILECIMQKKKKK